MTREANTPITPLNTSTKTVILLDETVLLGDAVWRIDAEVTVFSDGSAHVDIQGATGPHCVWYMGERFERVVGRVGFEVVREKLIAAARLVHARIVARNIP